MCHTSLTQQRDAETQFSASYVVHYPKRMISGIIDADQLHLNIV